MTKGRVSHAMPTLFVTSLRDGIAFYLRLGAEESWRFGEPRETHAGLRWDELPFMLVEETGSRPPQFQYAFVDGIESFHRRIRDAFEREGVAGAYPVASMSPLLDADYGMRDFELRDPWGNRWTFGEALDRLPDR